MTSIGEKRTATFLQEQEQEQDFSPDDQAVQQYDLIRACWHVGTLAAESKIGAPL